MIYDKHEKGKGKGELLGSATSNLWISFELFLDAQENFSLKFALGSYTPSERYKRTSYPLITSRDQLLKQSCTE
jgi:hypothetical protein